MLENARSYTLNNFSLGGREQSIDGRGNVMREMQVFADGRKEVVASTNARLGWIVKPSGGSLSAPVVNCRTLPRLKPTLLPPVGKTNMTNCFSNIFSVGYLLTTKSW